MTKRNYGRRRRFKNKDTSAIGKPKKKPLPEITEAEAQDIAADWEDELFGEDADYMRAAGLADKIGNK